MNTRNSNTAINTNNAINTGDTIHSLLATGKRRLTASGIAEAELDAKYLLEAASGIAAQSLLASLDSLVSAEVTASYEKLLERRISREPLQHILGEWEFMGYSFSVSPSALIPRQDTGLLVETALKNLSAGARILDLCTGTGCVLLSILANASNCIGLGADISEAALDLARVNEERIRMQCAKEINVSWKTSDLFQDITETFDIIVANPPYIPTAEIPSLMPEVSDFEPRIALDGGKDGLHYLYEIIHQARKHLDPHGQLFLEIGYDQADSVAEKMRSEGYCGIKVEKDLAGNDRVVHAEL